YENPPPVIFRNFLGNCQSQSKACGLGGIKRRKNLLAILRWNAGAGVRESKLQKFRPSAASDFPGVDFHFAALRHRLNGVGQDVKEASLDLSRIQLKGGHGLRPIHADLDVLPAALLFRQGYRLFQRGAQITRGESRRHLPSDGKKIIHQLIEPPNYLLDVLEIALQLGPATHIAIEMLGANLIDGKIDEVQ